METLYNNYYFDIESLSDVFCLCGYSEKTNNMDMYYLLDITMHHPFSLMEEQELDSAIRAANRAFDDGKGFTGKITFRDLANIDQMKRLVQTFGCEPGFPCEWSSPIVKTTDAEYDENVHPFIMGYNSHNYDLTMLAWLFGQLIGDNFGFLPPTTQQLRTFNDELFSSRFKSAMPDRLRCTIVRPQEIFEHPSRGAHPRYHMRDVIKLGNQFLYNEGWNASDPAYFIRNAMINSGRHIDVARLNEKQSRVGLKRLLGMLGYQILESDEDLSETRTAGDAQDGQHRSFESLKSLFAYNASDTLNLRNLFHHKTYVAAFELKKQMLVDYPELVYDQKRVEQTTMEQRWRPELNTVVTEPVTKLVPVYAPDPRPDNVRARRHTINSSSAQLAAGCLSPYGNLEDEPVVTFMYPSEKKARELGIPRRNILDETEMFIKTRLEPIAKGEEGRQIIESLHQMIAMYRGIEGEDFNASHSPDGEAASLKAMSDTINVPYMAPDGTASDCYITFSVGGLHGAQYNKPLFDEDLAAFRAQIELFERVKAAYGTPLSLLTDINAKGKPCRRKTFDLDGETYNVSDFLKSGSTMKKAEWKRQYVEAKPPELFPADAKGRRKLLKRYALTSFGPTNHEDFTSYYPILLVNLSAYENPGLGYDRYFEIFGNKQKFGKLMKDKSIDAAQRGIYSNMRNGTKLILNSASGASDVEYNTSIRMNNRITAMRIIGQMFTWRIGQAQSLEGAKVVSTNTDGLYTEFDEELNAKILEREAAAIQIGIEPEPCFLVSKDANNRFEGRVNGRTGDALKDVTITSASGGQLACREGPNPEKALAHPAIQDWALGEFLKYKALKGAMDEYEPEAGKYLLGQYAVETFPERRKRLQMFQNIIAASLSTAMYPFASHKPVTPDNEDSIRPIAMQHYNRVFYVDPDLVPDEHKKDIVYLCMAYVRPTRANESVDASPLALHVIKDLMGDSDALARGVPKLKKINGIELSTPCIICNEDLLVTDKIQPEWLDIDYYNKLMKSAYTGNWQNKPAGADDEGDEDEDEESED